MNSFIHYIKSHKIVILICLILTIIPFFWLKPGEMDLGGDGPRLYFYDPLNFLKSQSLYHIVPWSTGEVRPDFYGIPFYLLLALLKAVFQSPYVLISLFSALELVAGFLAIYAIVKEMASHTTKEGEYAKAVEVAAILAGLLYIIGPGMVVNRDRPVLSHYQVFLNPSIFYFLLRYCLTGNLKYIWFTLLFTVIISPNFAFISAPPIFAFYPLAIIFLLIAIKFVFKKKIYFKGLFLGLVVFFALGVFHLVPEILQSLDPSTFLYQTIFGKESFTSNESYFFAILFISKVSLSLFSQAPFTNFFWTSVVVPFVVVAGLLSNRGKQKLILLTAMFFLITFFLVSANISYSGNLFYGKLFYLPGFSMFRNFYVQWAHVFTFFYSLLFGQALILLFSKWSINKIRLVAGAIVLLLILSAWPLLTGKLVNQTLFTTKDIKAGIIFEPEYEEALSYIRSLPVDSKILTLPFSDCCYQVIFGANKAAYVGMSTIAYLTGKNDFAGHGSSLPFSQSFFELAKNHDYERFKEMLGLLNILYVFYNSDPRIYDTGDFNFPYSPAYSRAFFPQNQAEYKDFVEKISTKKIFERGTYSIYEIDKSIFLPHFYLADSLVFYEDDPSYNIYDKSKSFLNPTVDSKAKTSIRVTYLEKSICKSDLYALKLCGVKSVGELQNAPKITFQKINKTKYKILVTNAYNPYMLIFSNAFHKDWEIYLSQTTSLTNEAVTNTYLNGQVSELNQKDIFFDSKTFETVFLPSVVDKTHILVNGYANGWYIEPSDVGGKSEYELIVELKSQRVFYFCLIFSVLSLIGFAVWGATLFSKRKK